MLFWVRTLFYSTTYPNCSAGGITKLTSVFMAQDGVLDRFNEVAQREYSLAFPTLNGESIPLCISQFQIFDPPYFSSLTGVYIPFALPVSQVPTGVLTDFTLCQQ